MIDLIEIWGRRIRAYRKLKGMTQKELASCINISVPVLGKVEKGRLVPSQKLLESIAEALQLEVNDFKDSEHFKTSDPYT
jgi:transcriptional regulator with XRE-family HTH domain